MPRRITVDLETLTSDLGGLSGHPNGLTSLSDALTSLSGALTFVIGGLISDVFWRVRSIKAPKYRYLYIKSQWQAFSTVNH